MPEEIRWLGRLVGGELDGADAPIPRLDPSPEHVGRIQRRILAVRLRPRGQEVEGRVVEADGPGPVHAYTFRRLVGPAGTEGPIVAFYAAEGMSDPDAIKRAWDALVTRLLTVGALVR